MEWPNAMLHTFQADVLHSVGTDHVCLITNSDSVTKFHNLSALTPLPIDIPILLSHHNLKSHNLSKILAVCSASSYKCQKKGSKRMSCSRATFLPVQRQAIHITLPVPEQEPQRSPATATVPDGAEPMSGILGTSAWEAACLLEEAAPAGEAA